MRIAIALILTAAALIPAAASGQGLPEVDDPADTVDACTDVQPSTPFTLRCTTVGGFGATCSVHAAPGYGAECGVLGTDCAAVLWGIHDGPVHVGGRNGCHAQAIAYP